MDKQLILALDIGSSSVRGALFDDRGRLLLKTFVRDERRMAPTRDGGAEIPAEKAFRQVVNVIDGVLERSQSVREEITKIVSCTFWHSLIGVDETGDPTTHVLGWADNRSREFVGILRKRFDEAAIHNHTGCRLHPGYWPAKLLWLRKRSTDAWAKTARWISFSDLLTLRLCGSAVTSISMASGTGLFDLRRLTWAPELAKFLNVKPGSLPEIGTEVSSALPLLPKWRRRWPRLKDAQFLLSVSDGAANNIGSGAVGKGTAALMLGTSGALRMVYDGDPPDPIPSGLFCYRLDRERVVLGGALSDGGGLYDYLKRLLRVDLSDAAIAQEIARRGPNAHGLTVLPFFAGERSTGYSEFATGSIHGLTMAHDAIDILQASMESVGYRLAEISDQLNSVTPIKRIIASGGALKASPVWTQIIADVLGHDIYISAELEASLRGAVLLELEKTGKMEFTDEQSANKTRTISFHPTSHAIYRKARKRHNSVYISSGRYN
ncbi:MAG TPA: gluconokinase [Pyrinomonadaceae bacterium]|nr:gluconokinase [Pyrinomonadaceae bacterium]